MPSANRCWVGFYIIQSCKKVKLYHHKWVLWCNHALPDTAWCFLVSRSRSCGFFFQLWVESQNDNWQEIIGRFTGGGVRKGLTPPPPRISLTPLIKCSTPPKFRFTQSPLLYIFASPNHLLLIWKSLTLTPNPCRSSLSGAFSVPH
jgi:hypothetical protein